MLKSLKYLVPALGGTAGVLALSYVVADQLVTDFPAPLRDGYAKPANAQEATATAESTEAEPMEADTATAETAPAETEAETVATAPVDAEGAEPADRVVMASDEPMAKMPKSEGLGREALPEEIAAWDIDVRPDGMGLPVGSGDVATGEKIYTESCAACHGTFGEGSGRWPVLAGGEGSLDSEDPVKTTGSYWPYLSTIYDYIHRAMPFGNAQSLTDDEVYALTAYILNLNFLVEDDFVLSNENFLEVEMPNEGGFYMDDRPETELPQFSAEVCMTDCKPEVEITMRAAVLDVTPDDGSDDETTEAAAEETEAKAEPEETPAVEAPATDAAADTATPAEPAAQEEAALDPELIKDGERVFKKCAACHQVGEGAKNRVGPQLNGIVGRPIGGEEDFKYSGVFEEAHAAGEVWDPANLAAFLADPRGAMKGTKMSFSGLRKEKDQQAVVEYLRSLSQ